MQKVYAKHTNYGTFVDLPNGERLIIEQYLRAGEPIEIDLDDPFGYKKTIYEVETVDGDVIFQVVGLENLKKQFKKRYGVSLVY